MSFRDGGASRESGYNRGVVNWERLESELERFEGDADARRVVARQARDLADSELVAEDLGYELTVDTIVDELADAPPDHSLVERWNWWIGSLELSHGGYERFQVRVY
jgi:hypothetical protein